ncbi:class I SAM-dependent methyltransferase [Saccharibacillus alkalitolerans]|uniref:Class I SAM-dependent methyltransferase n=1 Tax=Saccharibacillus alkalitolerans TaxID=2705290 RepID=A0ABX0F0D6_9BACL|nr:class I SAM-dependent methyltransferase [Saccharibacillus alkalitolerans]NGZ74467.1 class I SAM-dependent methyltransferase [Saccharibacillus alkalitolerans]
MIIVTTGISPAEAELARARKLAEQAGSRLVPRGRTSIPQLFPKYGADAVLIVTQGKVRLFREDQPVLEYHPSMGYVRAKRLLKGEPDPMIDAARVREGDAVLDCTAGLGTDSLVFAVRVGPSGLVRSLEASPELSVLLREGLSSYEVEKPSVTEAMRRIEVVNADHLEYLRSLPDDSFDIVYFDPMFRKPVYDSSAISPLRAFADARPLSEESIREAVRVARRTVVLKEKKGSGEMERLGFVPDGRNHAKITYGVIRVD